MKQTRQSSADRFSRELDWNLLRTFVVMAEASSLTQAAEILRIKQPTATAALQRLEAIIGKKLLNRGPNGYELTVTGHILYREAVEISGSVKQLNTTLREVTDQIQGHVSIVMASHVVTSLFDDVLAEFHKRNPLATLQIDIVTSKSVLTKVLEKNASLGICLIKNRNPKLRYLEIFREYFGLFCGPTHPLYGKRDLTTKDLAGFTSVSFVTDQMDDALRSVTIMRAEAGLTDDVVASSANLEEVRRLIVAGLGIGPLPLHVASKDVEEGTLWRLPPYENMPEIKVYFIWHPDAKMNRAELDFLSLLQKKIDSTPLDQKIYR